MLAATHQTPDRSAQSTTISGYGALMGSRAHLMTWDHGTTIDWRCYSRSRHINFEVRLQYHTGLASHLSATGRSRDAWTRAGLAIRGRHRMPNVMSGAQRADVTRFSRRLSRAALPPITPVHWTTCAASGKPCLLVTDAAVAFGRKERARADPAKLSLDSCARFAMRGC